MNYQEIIQKITLGLSGNPEADMKYLDEKMKEYKDHEFGKEIARACGRLMYELFSEEKKNEFAKIIDNSEKGIRALFDEVKFNVYKKDIDKSLNLLEPAIKEAEESEFFKEDEVSVYYNFDEPFEHMLADYHLKGDKDIREANFPYAEMYAIYGSTLIEAKRIEDAQVALQKARKWNPISCDIAFEYIETFKMLGDLEVFAEKTKEVFKYIFRPEKLARGYRNMGYYYVEKEEYQLARACYEMSLQYDRENHMAMLELFFISEKSPETKTPEFDEIKILFEKEGIPVRVDDDVFGLAAAYAKQAMEDNMPAFAVYLYEIINGFLHDEDISGLINSLKSQLDEGE